jgi:hypothetical protein
MNCDSSQFIQFVLHHFYKLKYCFWFKNNQYYCMYVRSVPYYFFVISI